jgi:hypothetical protein
MFIPEDDVKNAMKKWMTENDFSEIVVHYGTSRGYDVDGVHSITGKRMVIECKGEAKTGDQHSRSWGNVASALLTSLNETEDPENSHQVGMAFPDTVEYRGRMRRLENFCKKQLIAVFWVSDNGDVTQW